MRMQRNAALGVPSWSENTGLRKWNSTMKTDKSKPPQKQRLRCP